MLQQENRLRKTRDIEITFQEGRFFPGNFVNLKIWKVNTKQFPKRNYDENELKFAFVVSTKIDKRAVIRNRFKRRMREVIRLFIKDAKIQKGFFVLVMAKKEIIDREYSEIAQDITSILTRARLLL